MEYLTTIISGIVTLLVIVSYIKFIKYKAPEGEDKDPYHVVSKTYDTIIFILVASTAFSYIQTRINLKKEQTKNVVVQNKSNKELTKK